jgi:hypothetical protein
MNAKHTPGPWRVCRYWAGWFVTAPDENGASNEQTIAEFREVQHGCLFTHRAEQDARLFAAAPDLLAALRNILASGVRLDSKVDAAAYAAIAKAEGQQ